MEATPRFVRRVVIVFVDDSGPSTIAALRRARSLRPTTVRAVHFVIDGQHSERLRADWPPDAHVPPELVDCPGRSLAGCAVDLIRDEAELPGAEVTVILPRQSIATPMAGPASAAGWHGRPDRPGVGPGARRRGDDYRAAGSRILVAGT
jgi:hypothetical protein